MQNNKLMHNLPTRTILNVGISCFTNFPIIKERILWAGCLKNHKANEQNLTATTTASGPHLVSAASRESRDYARLEPTFCRSPRKPFYFLGGRLRKSKANVLSKERTIVFLEGEWWNFRGKQTIFFWVVVCANYFFPTASFCKQITCALPC